MGRIELTRSHDLVPTDEVLVELDDPAQEFLVDDEPPARTVVFRRGEPGVMTMADA
jgi:hypothetical protein